MRLVLSSDFPSIKSEDVVGLIREVGPNPRIAWVAPSTSSAQARFPLATVGFRSFGFTDIELVDADSEPSDPNVSLLDHYDVVYLTGGDPIIFRRNLRRSGLAKNLQEFAAAGRLVVGASGGAMQLTSNVSLFRLLSDSVEDVNASRSEYDGLGLVGYEILPHLNRHDAAFLEKVRQYSELVEHDIVALEDGAAVVADSESTYKSLGQGARFYRGVQTAL